jgi:membrane protein implicated in regulation of membrane protease activity
MNIVLSIIVFAAIAAVAVFLVKRFRKDPPASL